MMILMFGKIFFKSKKKSYTFAVPKWRRSSDGRAED
jgi:hypothetical protein